MRIEHHILTPECVEFVYEVAGLPSRLLAVLVDHLVLTGMLALVVLGTCSLAIWMLPLGGAAVGLGLIGTFLVYFGYFAYFEWRWNGQTPGKRLLSLRVIDDRGTSLEPGQILLRNLLRVVDLWPLLTGLDYLAFGAYGLGGLCALCSPGTRRIGDWAARTLVVRSVQRAAPGMVLHPSERYNTLTEQADVRRRIRTRLSLEERETLLQLCLRREELEFPVRQELFGQAAAALEVRLDLRREAFLSEEKFVQNVTAAALELAHVRPELTGNELPGPTHRAGGAWAEAGSRPGGGAPPPQGVH